MAAERLTAMEEEALRRFHLLYQSEGFPRPEEVVVHGRENTGSGRYVDLAADAEVRMKDGDLDLNGSFIEMSGLPYGMMAVAHIEGKRLRQLEFAVYGVVTWDGVEREWRFVS